MVDDEASTYFMALLFAQIEQHHASPSQALRLAQLQMSKDKRWDSPFYWGSFVIQGNWL
jgi:CHAT domain-containing protein